ncbi:MFS transporter [Kitasatospora terrestris]
MEPLWAVPGTVTLYYATLFQKEAGLTTWQIGAIASASLWLGFLAQLAAGAVTDRLGRRRTTLLFDLLSWSLPMFLWAFADGFWTFLSAGLCSALGRVVNLSFFLLVTEDADEHQRPRIFAAIKLVVMAAGLLTPLAGAAMAHWGTLPALRAVYLFGGISMTALFLVRHRLTTETAAGRQAAEAPAGLGRGLRLLFSARELWPVVAVVLLTDLAVQFTLFQVVYLADELHPATGLIALQPPLGAFAAFACYRWVMPRRRHRPMSGNVLHGLLLGVAGWAAFLAVPGAGTPALLLATVLTAAGPFLLESYRDALVVTAVPPADRATLSSAVQSAAALAAVPCGWLAALLHTRDPLLPFTAVLTCYALATAAILPLTARRAVGRVRA